MMSSSVNSSDAQASTESLTKPWAGPGTWRCRNSTTTWTEPRAPGPLHRDGRFIKEELVAIPRMEASCLLHLVSQYPFIVYLGFCLWRRLVILDLTQLEFHPPLAAGDRFEGESEVRHVEQHNFGAIGNLRSLTNILPSAFFERHLPVTTANLALDESSDALGLFADFVLGACRNNQPDVAKILLQSLQVDPAMTLYCEGSTEGALLAVAAQYGHVTLVKVLLSHGADTELKDNYQMTALHWAAQSGQVAGARTLLEVGKCNVMAGDNDNWNPSHAAAENGHAAMLKLLLEHGADLKSANQTGWTPLHHAADLAKRAEECIRFLVESGADVEARTEEQATPLSLAARSCKVGAVRTLLEIGVDINTPDKYNWTPLIGAAGAKLKEPGDAAKSTEVVELLLRAGADATLSNNHRDTALHWAALRGNAQSARLLLELGKADVEGPTESTPLQCAIMHGNLEATRVLVEVGHANLEAARRFFETPLYLAANDGHLEVASYLLSQGASCASIVVGAPEGKPDEELQKQRFYSSPLHAAAASGHLMVVKLLVEEGRADIDAAGDAGKTPLHCAIYGAHVAVVDYLLGKGASTAIEDDTGVGALQVVPPTVVGTRLELELIFAKYGHVAEEPSGEEEQEDEHE